MSDTATFTGQCYCGALAYSAAGKPMFKAQCHCRECQYFSGGGPNYFMILPVSGFEWTKGAPRTFTRSDLDAPVTRTFCETCGTHITTELTDGERLVLKVGTLDDPATFGGPRAAIHMADQQPFHLVAPDVPCFDRLP
ncbi:GFA family protein [Sulfitobacter aestuariivivens]|uniref:GFA family protein n=1 Tax=Sulfitobacter aestuariivivens TaxID=2766981 RepID=A0A927D7J7_9RHOB|nr:GFA family protein [Sulfitobacter aestuariivivens]MBD3665856.1 GFA family protein [Sulfitobacter aestuariivivens]